MKSGIKVEVLSEETSMGISEENNLKNKRK